jgi:putative heme utilization carrier protein HutX
MTAAQLKQRLAADPDGIIENLAREHGVTTLEATCLLPAQHCRWAGADDFGTVMADLTRWGEVLMIVHTPNIVLECKGAIPPGEFGRGYFNIHGAGPIGGHIKAERCAAIAFVRRPFMGRDSCSIQFFDTAGDAMFKIFVRRGADRALDEAQVALFEALAARFG